MITLYIKRKRNGEEVLNFVQVKTDGRHMSLLQLQRQLHFPLAIAEWLGCVALQKCVVFTLRLRIGTIMFNKM